MTGLGDSSKLICGLRYMLARVGALGMIEREATNQLGFKRVSQLTGQVHLLLEVLIERDVRIFGAVLYVAELDLAERRADRRNIHAEMVLEMTKLGDFRLRELHHVLDTAADIDEPKAVILQPE